MNNISGQFIHPEAFHEVWGEYERLHSKHPATDSDTKWALARDYAWTLALANTFNLKAELGIA